MSCIIKCFHVSHMPSIHWKNIFFNKVQLFLLCYFLRFVSRQLGEHIYAGRKINKPVITGDTLKTWLFNYLNLSKTMLYTLIFSDFHVWVKTNSKQNYRNIRWGRESRMFLLQSQRGIKFTKMKGKSTNQLLWIGHCNLDEVGV